MLTIKVVGPDGAPITRLEVDLWTAPPSKAPSEQKPRPVRAVSVFYSCRAASAMGNGARARSSTPCILASSTP